MKKHILIIILIVLVQSIYAQVKTFALKNEPVYIKLKGYYFSSVIDNRKDQSTIGTIYLGMFNNEVQADLEGGVKHSVQKYVNAVFPKDTSLTPIVISINHLQISEQIIFAEYGTAEIQVVFYEQTEKGLVKLFQAKAQLEESSMSDVTDGHESRIRQVLLMCITDFNNSEWRKTRAEYTEADILSYEKIDTTSSRTPNYSADQEALVWNNLISLSGTIGANADGLGITYYGYFKKKGAWFFPFIASIEQYSIHRPRNKSLYDEAALSYWMPGFAAFKEFSKSFYLNFSFKVPIGFETLTDKQGNETNNFLIGLIPSQSIYQIPSESGLSIGFGVYELLLNSRVYPLDIGIMLMLGYKF